MYRTVAGVRAEIKQPSANSIQLSAGVFSDRSRRLIADSCRSPNQGELMPKPKYHIVVCTNSRPPGHPKPSCGSARSAALRMAYNMGLIQKGLTPGDVLVSGSSCLGPCEQGPTVVVYPDATWYSKVTEADVATIIDEHIKGGNPVAKLNPDAVWK